jgi:hypothetical protein
MLAPGTQVRGFKPGWSRRIFRADLRHIKEPYNEVEVTFVKLNLVGHFSLIVPPFADRVLSRRLTWRASGDERVNQKRD